VLATASSADLALMLGALFRPAAVKELLRDAVVIVAAHITLNRHNSPSKPVRRRSRACVRTTANGRPS
jgi:hypothetical protein